MFKYLFLAIIKSKDGEMYLHISNSFVESYLFNLSKTPIALDNSGYELKNNLEKEEYSILSRDNDIFSFIDKLNETSKSGISKIITQFKVMISCDHELQYDRIYKYMLMFTKVYGSKKDLKEIKSQMDKNIKECNNSN